MVTVAADDGEELMAELAAIMAADFSVNMAHEDFNGKLPHDWNKDGKPPRNSKTSSRSYRKERKHGWDGRNLKTSLAVSTRASWRFPHGLVDVEPEAVVDT